MAKDTTRVRRRERKNISSGVAHVNSTLQQHHDHDHGCAGQRDLLVICGRTWASRARVSPRRMPLRLLRKTPRKKLQEHGMRPWKSMVRPVPGRAVNPRCVPCRRSGFTDHDYPGRDADSA